MRNVNAGREIRAQIVRTGWTSKRVAAAIGVHEGHLSKVLNGHRPLTEELRRAIEAVLSRTVAA